MTFPSLENLEVIVGLLTGLISILLCLREYGGLRRGKEREEWPVGGTVRTHTTFIKLTVLYGCGFWCPKTITILTSKVTAHRSLQHIY